MAGTQQQMAESSPASAAVAGQRCYMTMLFADLSDSTRISTGMDAEDFAELLASIQQVFERVIPKHGGTIVRMDGDGVTAVFGYPRPHEDDGRRATEAALELRDQAQALETTLVGQSAAIRLHTGIHSGLILLSEGDLVRGRFEMMGEATNIASRLAGKARANEIIVSEATLGPERHFFRIGKRQLLRLRGRDEPIAAYRVLGREAIVRRFDAWQMRGVTPFSGRRTELDRLKLGLDRAMAGESVLLVVLGAPGLGKTRLVTEFLSHARARGCAICRADCEAYLAGEPLHPFRQVGEAILGGPMPDGALGPTEQADLVAGAAAAGPVVVAIDDWQWSDHAANQALQALIGRAKRNLIVVLSAREVRAGDPALKDAEFIHLPPLSKEDSDTAVFALLPGSDPFLCARIFDYSGGNPLFMEELCHSIGAGGDWRPVPGGSGWLEALVQARFRRLPKDAAAAVRVAAVIGISIPAWLFEALTGTIGSDPLFAQLADADFVYRSERPGMLRFKHGITRDVIYQSVGLRDRRALHLRIAAELRRHCEETGEEEPVEALAYHYRGGGDLHSAAHYGERSGDRAQAASALDRAQDQYCTALECLDVMDGEAEVDIAWNRVVQKLGMATIFDPSHLHLPIFVRAAERARARGDLAALVWAEHQLGYVNFALGERHDALTHCERALATASELGDERLLARVKETIARTHVTTADYERALPLLGDAIQARRRHGRQVLPSGINYSLAMNGLALADMGRFEESELCFEEASADVSDLRHEVSASIYSLWGAACSWQGRDADAFHYARMAADVAKRVRARYTYSMCLALAGYAQWRLTSDEKAIGSMLDATSWLFEARDARQFSSLAHGWLAEALVATGRMEQARNHAARALARAHKLDRLGGAMACRALARAAATGFGKRPPEHYLRLAGLAAKARMSEHEAARNQLCQAQIQAPADPGAAAISLAQAQRRFAELGMRWPVAPNP